MSVLDQIGTGLVGVRVQLTNSAGVQVEGEIFTYDKASQLLVLEEFLPQTQKKNLRFMKASHLRNIKVLSTPQSRGEPAGPPPRLPAIDIRQVLQTEAMALQAAAMEELKIGKGVSAEAQDLFDALVFTLPCLWDGTTIVVGVVGQNEVRVTEPYTPESATGGDEKSLAHVRKVLAGERAKLAAGAGR
eukprot:COSAG01_NODE_2914_length_6866_cov_17.396483_3_plen_188_part_00